MYSLASQPVFLASETSTCRYFSLVRAKEAISDKRAEAERHALGTLGWRRYNGNPCYYFFAGSKSDTDWWVRVIYKSGVYISDIPPTSAVEEVFGNIPRGPQAQGVIFPETSEHQQVVYISNDIHQLDMVHMFYTMSNFDEVYSHLLFP